MSGASLYIPYAFRSFQGFSIKDIKEYRDQQHMELILEKEVGRTHNCSVCGEVMGAQDGRYWVKARHLRVFGWTVSVCFFREKRHCARCQKIRSEFIDFICPTSPHMTLELAWWVNRLSEITTVISVSRLESIDKMTCYKVDKHILLKLLQGYKIPPLSHIAVDEVYARGPKQLKEGENRDDLFLTVVVDLRTRKVVWVSQGRSQEALDDFFEALGKEASSKIKVVATDQHDAYSASVKKHCPEAVVVWDRFHLVQKFNEVLNEERRDELERIDPEGPIEDLMNNKYKYIYLTKAKNRSELDKKHIDEVMKLNTRMAKLEIIKEHFHKMFDCFDWQTAQAMLCDCYDWAHQIKAKHIMKWILSVVDDKRFWNYFEHRVTTGLSEGMNRVIKGIKWQAYGYKDMQYFALKIMQKAGYLNLRYALSNYR